MIKKNFVFVLPVFLLFTFLVKADVPPDPGYKRVTVDLVTETAEDLSDHRFFLDFYGDLREVEIKSKGRTVIEPMGGGARYRSGTFLAIPKKSLNGFEEKLSSDELKTLSESIKAKKIEGVTELAKHRFTLDIPKGETPGEVFYTITREKEALKATRNAEETPKSVAVPQLISPNSRTGLTIGGIFISLAVLIVGVLAFRKAAKKSKINE
jgi:hypothetical protein